MDTNKHPLSHLILPLNSRPMHEFRQAVIDSKRAMLALMAEVERQLNLPKDILPEQREFIVASMLVKGLMAGLATTTHDQKLFELQLQQQTYNLALSIMHMAREENKNNQQHSS